jgi:hypothetical protein
MYCPARILLGSRRSQQANSAASTMSRGELLLLLLLPLPSLAG